MASPTTDRRLGLSGNTAVKTPVDVATTANITLSGEQTIDGVLTSGSRVLVKNQTNAINNGIYDSDSGAWTRALDANGTYDFRKGTIVLVASGTQSKRFFHMTTADPIVGTTSLAFEESIAAGTGADSIGFDPTINYVGSTVGRRLAEIISVGDFGAVAVDDTAAFQAALTFASLRIDPTANSLNDKGVGIYVPSTKIWEVDTGAMTDSLAALDTHGLAIFGDPGRGSRIEFSDATGIGFVIGDSTKTIRTRFFAMRDLIIANTDLDNVATAIKLFRTVDSSFENVVFCDWYVTIDMYRSSTHRWVGRGVFNQQRTTPALAICRMWGTDDSQAPSPETYSPGGGHHFDDIEIIGGAVSGSSELSYTETGLLIKSVDGLYAHKMHMTRCQRSIAVEPDGTAESYTTIDMLFSSCYLDQPAVTPADVDTMCMSLAGEVKTNIALADGTLVNSSYQQIRWINGYMRGSGVVSRTVWVKIGDSGGAFYASGRRARVFAFDSTEINGSGFCGVQISGRTSGGYYEPHNVSFTGVAFEQNNSGSNAGIGSAITGEAASMNCVGNTFGVDSGTTDYVVYVDLTDVGSSDGSASMLEQANDFSQATATIEYVHWTAGIAGAAISVGPSLYPGVGQSENQQYKFTTLTTAAYTAWSRTISPDGASGYVRAELSGSSTSGARAQVYVWEAGYWRSSTGSALHTTTTNFASVIAWNASTMGVVPTAQLVTNTLTIQVASSSTMTWSLDIRRSQSR